MVTGMRSVGNRFKDFMTDEEIPRWLGLSLVLVYLVGLGTVANMGITQARRSAAAEYHQHGRYAASVLAARLSSDSVVLLPRDERYRHALQDFASNFGPRIVRVVDSARRVVASANPADIGTVAAPAAPGVKRAPEEAEVLVRVPVASALDVEGSHSADAPDDALWVEVVFPPEPAAVADGADTAQVLAAVLVVMGALFVVYRCLREHLKGVSRIARKLKTHGTHLEEELGALRIADSLDSVTVGWNELVELAERLSLECRRSEADVELSKALQQVGGGTLAAAFNAHPDGLVYVADDSCVEFANSTACHLFGWRIDQIKRVSLDELEAKKVGGRVLDLMRASRLPDGTLEGRAEYVRAEEGDGGDQSCYSVRIIPVSGSRRQGHALVVIRDVSQQMRADLAREEFITQVTHELRTPLTNIRAYAETLSSGVFDDPKVITDCYNVITKETRRLSRLIEDVLSVSQLEVGSLELHFDSVDLGALLTEGVRDVRNLAEEKGIDLQLVLPAKLAPARVDRDKLAVVINNLLGNAIKYTLVGGNVVVGCNATSSEVVITVKDNGIGIGPEDKARVFEKFQRADDPDVRAEAGTGIGLFTAREIVRRHHGDIELISEKGQGSTFLVRLPQAESRATTHSAKEEAQGHADHTCR